MGLGLKHYTQQLPQMGQELYTSPRKLTPQVLFSHKTWKTEGQSIRERNN